MSPNQERQAVEALAQALYEAEDPAGIAWVKRAQIIREPWISTRLAAAEDERDNAGFRVIGVLHARK